MRNGPCRCSGRGRVVEMLAPERSTGGGSAQRSNAAARPATRSFGQRPEPSTAVAAGQVLERSSAAPMPDRDLPVEHELAAAVLRAGRAGSVVRASTSRGSPTSAGEVPLRTTAPWTYPVGSTCTSWGRKRFGSPDPCAIFPLVRVPGHDAPLHALLAHHSPETNRSGSTLRSGPVQEKRTGPRRTRRARSACARRRGRLASRTGSRTRRSTAGRRRTGRSSPARSVPLRIAHPALLEVEEVVRAEHPDATGGGGHAQVLAAPHRHRSSVLSGGIPGPSGRGPIAAVLAATWCPARASRERVARRGRRGAARRSAREGVGSPTAPGGRCSALTGRALPAAADARTCGTGSPRWRSSPGSHQCEAAPVCRDRGCFAGLRSWWPGAGSNRRPSAFQADARTN